MKTVFLPELTGCALPAAEPFLKLGLVGVGDVVKNRIMPSLNAMETTELSQLEVAICSLEALSPIASPPHRYYRALPNNMLPLDDLYADGFLNSRTLWIVATPPQTHILFAIQLIGLCGRVAIEKPLATDPRQARVLRPYANRHFPLCPLDHKLFTVGSLRFLDQCRENPSFLRHVCHVEGVFFESSAFPHGRAQEDGIFDIQWHMFMLMIAAFKNLGQRFEIEVESATIARHGSDPSGMFSDATVCTASRLNGSVVSNELSVSFEFLQAKAAPRNEKYVQFMDAQNNILARVDLGESGWQAHGRMLKALTGPVGDMRHTLADAIALADLLSGVSAVIGEHPAYEFGSLPSFMRAAHYLEKVAPQRSAALRAQEQLKTKA